MPSEKDFLEIITKIESEIGAGVIGTSIVDSDSGMTLAVKSNRSDFDLTAASAFNSEIVKQKLKVMKALHIKASLEDMVMTLSDQIHIIKLFSGGATFLYLAVERANTNLAIARNAVTKHTASLVG